MVPFPYMLQQAENGRPQATRQQTTRNYDFYNEANLCIYESPRPFLPLISLSESSTCLSGEIYEPVFKCFFEWLENEQLANSFLINVHSLTVRRILENLERKTARKDLSYQSKG